MQKTLSLESEKARAAVCVIDELTAAGFQALLVGGCVRDLLLGQEPEDYDVATDAEPEQVKPLFDKTILVGEKFGVVLAVINAVHVEIATFRKETGYSDRRRPDHVEFTTAAEDARRRDFTINALFYDIGKRQVVDHVNGEADIDWRVIRCVGDPRERFSEDALRLLRALRFASSLGFAVDEATWKSIGELRNLILEISRERIREELIKGFTRAHPDKFLALLDESGLLELILPEVAATKGCDQPPEFHPEGDVFTHTKLMLSLLPENPSPTLAFATLLHDIGKPPTAEFTDRIRFNNHHKVGAEMADAICRRLAFSNEDREKIVSMVERHMDFINVPRMKESTLRRFLASPDIDEELELHRVDCLGSHRMLDNYDFALEKLKLIRAEEPEGKLPPPLVNGDDLIAIGLKPGPAFKDILTQIQDAQLEGTIRDRDEALALLLEIVGPKP